jgi:glutathione S-transferase
MNLEYMTNYCCQICSQPNLYATSGFHKEADAFNRVQRGHQNYFENITLVTVSTLIAGLQYPIAASVCNVLYSVGSILFQVGYADTTLDVAMARYKRGGGLKWIGLLGSLGLSVNVAGKLLGWWSKTA